MNREPLMNGQVDMLLLAILARGPGHGYAIVEALRAGSGGAVDLPEGTVYPALYRLEAVGLLESRAELVSGRRRRTYRITRAGRAALRQRAASWDALVRGMNGILRGDALAG